MTKQGKSAKKQNKNKIKNSSKLPVDKQKIPRSKEKYAALNFKRQVKTRLDALETDYVNKLSDEEKAWLNAFLEETVITNFQHKGQKFYTSKKSKSEHYGSNNARNRCMFTKAKAMNMLVNTANPQALANLLDKDQAENSDYSNYEDALIEAISLKRSKKLEET